MYKIASDKRQSSLHRGRLSDWVGGEEHLKDEDRLALLQQTARRFESEIVALPKESAGRRKLGLEKLKVQEQIKEIRDRLPKSPIDWKMHFVDEAKRLLSESQFKMIFSASKIAAQREQQKRELCQKAKDL